MGYMLPGFSLIRSGVWFSFGSQLCIWLFDLAKSVLLSERDLVILHSASSWTENKLLNWNCLGSWWHWDLDPWIWPHICL